jgi:hypothetical protein
VDRLTRRATRLTAGAVAPLAVALAIVLAIALGGCSDDGSDDPTPAPASSTASSPTDSTSPSESTDPSVEPASGLLLDTGSATFNLPEGWKDNKNGYPNTFSGSPEKSFDIRLITAIDLPAASGYTLDERAQDAMTQLPGSKLTRKPDIELDGVPAYHIAGTAPVRGPYEEMGTGYEGRAFSISFSLNGLTASERREIVDSVIASFRWKD